MNRKGKKEIVRIEEISDEEYSESENEEFVKLEDAKGIAVVNALYPNKKNKENKDKTKGVVIYATGIFALLSNPGMDKLISTAFPMTNSWLVLMIVKVLLFFILLYSSTFFMNTSKRSK